MTKLIELDAIVLKPIKATTIEKIRKAGVLTVQDLAIAYSTDPEQANQLKVRLGSLFPEEQIHIAQLGAGLGVHTGPGVLILALRGRG